MRAVFQVMSLLVTLVGLILLSPVNVSQSAFANPDKIIVLRFDDGGQSQYDNAVPKLNALGFQGVFAVVTSLIGGSGEMTAAELLTLQSQGHEIASHSNTHAHLNSLSSSALVSETNGASVGLGALGLKSPVTFVYPYGEGYDNATVRSAIENAGCTRASQLLDSDGGWNLSTGDRLAIGAYEIDHYGNATDTYFHNKANEASGNTIVAFTIHSVDDHKDDEYYLNVTDFDNKMDWLAANGFTIETFEQLNIHLGYFGWSGVGSTSYPTAKSITTTWATVDTSQSVFGGASGKFVAASSQYLSIAPSGTFALSSDFTFDFRIRLNSLPVDGSYFFMWSHVTDDHDRFGIRLVNTSGTISVSIKWLVSGVDHTISRNTSPNLSTSAWYHIAVVRSSGTIRIFQDGTQLGADATDSTAIPNYYQCLIGVYSVYNLLGPFDGWIDEWRESNTARWTSNFTPPTARYDHDSYTVLLLHMDTDFSDDVLTGMIKGTRATLTEKAATFDKISFYSHAAGNVRLAIYNNSSPKSKIWESGDTVVTAKTWNNVTITGVTNQAAGTYYLTVQWNPGTAYVAGLAYAAGSSSDGFDLYQSYGAYPSTMSGETSTSERYGIFVSYTNAAIIDRIAFTTGTQVLTAGTPSAIMTIQTQDASGPVNVPSGTTVGLTSTSGTGQFSESSSGPWSSTPSLTITAGTNSKSFYYKDTTVGTPTITAAESPSKGWTDATQVETVKLYTLTVNVSPVGTGSVSRNASAPYRLGQHVELTAVPSTGWSFSDWSGDLIGSANPATITITGNMTVTATFTQDEYVLTLAVSPIGSGSVTADPDQTSYHYGDSVLLTANANLGYTFSSWSDGLGTVSPRSIIINGTTSVTATFTENVDHFVISAIASPRVAGVAFQVTITAVDVLNNTVVGYSGSVNLSDLTVTASPGTAGPFVNGVLQVSVTITQSYIDDTITVTDTVNPSLTGMSNKFNVFNRLSGTVTGSGPVQGAWVSVYDPDTTKDYGAVTDSSGYYEILAPGDQNYIFDVWPPKLSGMMHHQERTLDLSVFVIGHDVELGHGFYVYGRVTGSSPVVGAWVSVWANGNGYGANTNSTGYYAFTAPAGDGYIFDVWPPMGSGVMHDQERGVDIHGDTEITKSLDAGLYIYGTITGTPAVQGAWVSLYDRDTQKSWGWVTDAQGYYQFTAPSGTNYAFDVWPPSGTPYYHYSEAPISLTANLLKDASLESGSLVHGTVTSSAGAVQGAWVSVWDPIKEQGWGGLTNASGYYGFGAPDGVGYVFDVGPPAGSRLVPDHETGFTVSGNTLKDVSLLSGNVLSGTIYYSNGKTPVAGAYVSLYDPGTKAVYSTTTDSNGQYTIVAPSYGNYVFDVWKGTNHYHGPSPIDLTSDRTYNANLTIPAPL